MNTRRFVWVALVGVLGMAGLPACSAIVGIKDLPTEDGNGSGSGGSGSGGNGSGSGSGGSSDRALRFIGTWTLTTGSNSSLCNGQTSTYTDSGTLTVARGSSSDLLITPPNGCMFEANITAANTATLVAGQSCSGQESGIAVIFFPSGTFQIDDGATTGQVNVSGNLDAENSSGQQEHCTFTQTDNYARAS